MVIIALKNKLLAADTNREELFNYLSSSLLNIEIEINPSI